jgi:hypothetical protein
MLFVKNGKARKSMKTKVKLFGIVSTAMLLAWVLLTMLIGQPATAVLTATLASVSWNSGVQ